VSVKELIAAARQVTGHAIPAVSAPRREGDPPSLFADPTRAKTAFAWKPPPNGDLVEILRVRLAGDVHGLAVGRDRK
jgi:UDP-glucose 4-epimerase